MKSLLIRNKQQIYLRDSFFLIELVVTVLVVGVEVVLRFLRKESLNTCLNY